MYLKIYLIYMNIIKRECCGSSDFELFETSTVYTL